MKRFLSLFFLFTGLLFGKWNNNYSFFDGDGNDSANAALNILSYILIVFGAYLFLHSMWKIFGSNDPQDKTRGALFTNVFLAILAILFIANQWVIKKLLGIE